jgi:hypothetical protein
MIRPAAGCRLQAVGAPVLRASAALGGPGSCPSVARASRPRVSRASCPRFEGSLGLEDRRPARSPRPPVSALPPTASCGSCANKLAVTSLLLMTYQSLAYPSAPTLPPCPSAVKPTQSSRWGKREVARQVSRHVIARNPAKPAPAKPGPGMAAGRSRPPKSSCLTRGRVCLSYCLFVCRPGQHFSVARPLQSRSPFPGHGLSVASRRPPPRHVSRAFLSFLSLRAPLPSAIIPSRDARRMKLRGMG